MPLYRRKGVVIGTSGDNYLIMLAEDSVYEVGPEVYYVWNLLDGTRGVEDVARLAAYELDLPLDKVRALVYRIVDALEKEGLVDEVD